MLARNPKTGKDLRIISLDTSVWRDQKTIVWLDEVPKDTSRWNRWDIGVTDVAVVDSLTNAGLRPDIVVCLGDIESSREWLFAGGWSKVRLVVVPKTLVDAIGLEKMLELRMGNLVCLDEMYDLYPFTGAKWDGTKEDAKALVALALHFGRSFPVAASAERTVFAANIGLRLFTTVVEPKPLWLVSQYYIPDKFQRKKEIDACLKMNLECSIIDRVVLLNEKELAPKHPKIQEKVIGKRLTYARVMRWIYEEAPDDVIIVFANSDIFLDAESWRLLWSIDLDTQAKFLALLRWDVDDVDEMAIRTAKLFGPRADSQDTWVVSAKAVKAAKWDWESLNFPFGQGGCDNAITLELFKNRFLVANPALTLKTYHYHASAIRGYDPKDIVDKPAYLYIQPSGLHDMRPVMDLAQGTSEPVKQLVGKPFPRLLRGPLSPAQARTFCTMVKRSTDGKVDLDPAGDNIWAPPKTPMYRYKNVFQTREGLLYTYNTILVGKTKASSEAWGASQLSSMAASLAVEDTMVAPLPDSIAKDAPSFILQYISKVLLLREQYASPNGEFWCSRDKACVEAMRLFRWPTKEVPVLSRDENLQTWCSNAAMWGYSDTPGELVSAEQVDILRSNSKWQEQIDEEKKLVIVVDSTWMTEEMIDMIETDMESKSISVKIIWPQRTATEVAIDAMYGAWGVILASKEMSPWSWALPKGAFVWEIQSEMQPSAALLHLAAAAELHHRLLIVAKGTPNVKEREVVLQKLLTDMGSFIKPMEPVQSVEPVATPIKIILPEQQDGFYGHAGDSFREMVHIWKQRGYVSVSEKPVYQVWMHEVGDTLLYDRPTLQWLERAPPNEKKWKRALFGNPLPPKDGLAWSFWPRRPNVVEDLVGKGLPMKSFEAREKTLVFYGRSENAVQMKHRTKADWASVCDDFSHSVNTVGKYPYTHAEYLEKLSQAKYGLCLAGFGYKCHREIECMAMGCVPIVGPEVDMTSYADAPQEGLHYFRAATPDDAKRLTATTAERWVMMSAACRQWWQKNASVEGMWELTKKLGSVRASSSSP